MQFFTRRFVRPHDLNTEGRLFGGQLLAWVDEEAVIYVGCQMRHDRLVTKLIDSVEFVAPVQCGDVLEFGMIVTSSGKSSLTVRSEVRRKRSKESVLRIGRIVMVAIDENGLPVPHSYAENCEREVA